MVFCKQKYTLKLLITYIYNGLFRSVSVNTRFPYFLQKTF